MDVSIGDQMSKILSEYSREVQQAANQSIDKISRESVSKLKSGSPKRSGAYARSWTRKTERNRGISTVIVHNSKHDQLTHLLENGHVIRNKKGTYGRVNGIKHIAPVEEWANEALVSEIERKL